MLHHSTTNKNDHWGVSCNDNWVLAQLQENGEQVRIRLTPAEAEHMAEQLFRFATQVRLRHALPSQATKK